MSYRTDEHNNPTAFTTDIARISGLVEGIDYTAGEPFTAGDKTYFTARILGNPIDTTLGVIDAIGFYTTGPAHNQRWSYIAMPKRVWDSLSRDLKVYVLSVMYLREGGVGMWGLFPAGKPTSY